MVGGGSSHLVYRVILLLHNTRCPSVDIGPIEVESSARKESSCILHLPIKVYDKCKILFFKNVENNQNEWWSHAGPVRFCFTGRSCMAHIIILYIYISAFGGLILLRAGPDENKGIGDRISPVRFFI